MLGEGVWLTDRAKGVEMSRQVVCPECFEDFRASSIFVERPSLTHCPFCGAVLQTVARGTARPLDDLMLEPGHEPSPADPSPVHRAA